MSPQFWMHLIGMVLSGLGLAAQHSPNTAPFSDALIGLGAGLNGGTGINTHLTNAANATAALAEDLTKR